MQPHRWLVRSILVAVLSGLLALTITVGAGTRPGVSHASGPPAARAALTPVTEATTLVALLATGDFKRAASYFDPALGVTPDALRAAWASLLAQVGPFRRYLAVRSAPVGLYTNGTVSCAFARGTADIIVTVDRQQRVAGLHFANVQRPASPPPYAHPAAFRERPLTVGAAPWTLPGTLTMPVGRGPFPAVVLVAGSGPLDRDETVGANKPFRDMAWGLASRGIAVLRYDKRTLVYGDRLTAARMTAMRFTVKQESIDDALAAVALLRKTPGVDAHRIFVLGHSLGGMLAPRIALGDPHLGGLIIPAGPTTPIEDEILRQERYLQSLGDATAAQVAAVAAAVARIKALKPAQVSSSGLLLGATPSYWLDLRLYRPAAVAARVRLPFLIAQGARDYQVTLQDYHGWQAALVSRHTVTFRLYPRLNHLFMPVNGPGTPADYVVPGHVDAAVVGDIVSWILAHR